MHTLTGKRVAKFARDFLKLAGRALGTGRALLIVIGQDENEFGPVLPYWQFPKVTVTKKDAIKLGMEDALVYPLTFTAFEDEAYGGFVGIGHAGAGFVATSAAGGFDGS